MRSHNTIFIKHWNHWFHQSGKRGNYRQNNGKYFTNWL